MVNTGDRRLSQLKHCTPSAPQYLPNVSPPPWRCLCILSQPLVRSHSLSPALPPSLDLSLSLSPCCSSLTGCPAYETSPERRACILPFFVFPPSCPPSCTFRSMYALCDSNSGLIFVVGRTT